MIRVVIADDHAVVRRGLRELLDAEDDIEVVAEAENGVDAVEAVKAEKPDVLVLDVNMPRMDGRQVCEEISGGGTRVLVLSAFEPDPVFLKALACGAGGYLTKSSPPSLLTLAVRAVAAGGVVMEPAVASGLAVEAPAPDDFGLSLRERDVLSLMGLGLRNKEIASRLWVSETTVKTHVAHILGKMRASRRAEAVALAEAEGLL